MLGNAKIEGLDEDLELDGVKYNIALCIFFIPYILFGSCNCCLYHVMGVWVANCDLEIPSNWLLSKAARPSLFLGTMIVAWGIVMTLSGCVQNFAGLCVTRLFMGFLE